MPEIILAETAGFCFGVQRAVETVYETADRCRSSSLAAGVYTYGPIIHNEDVVKDLENKGVAVVDEEGIRSLDSATVIIRSHGAPERIYRLCEEKGIDIVDATCPFVRKIHKIARQEHDKGRCVIIIGDSDHPEVAGIKGWAGEDSVVIESADNIDERVLKTGIKYSLVAQTTCNHEKLKEIIEKINKLKYDVICFNTVCNATYERQKEAAAIASKADAMIVIGSRQSSNTRKLYEICRERCSRTLLVGSVEDLRDEDLVSAEEIGITAGASTPKYIIEEVQNHVRNQF